MCSLFNEKNLSKAGQIENEGERDVCCCPRFCSSMNLLIHSSLESTEITLSVDLRACSKRLSESLLSSRHVTVPLTSSEHPM
jgi:hypothetical protein